jgi:hypothetical protein
MFTVRLSPLPVSGAWLRWMPRNFWISDTP